MVTRGSFFFRSLRAVFLCLHLDLLRIDSLQKQKLDKKSIGLIQNLLQEWHRKDFRFSVSLHFLRCLNFQTIWNNLFLGLKFTSLDERAKPSLLW